MDNIPNLEATHLPQTTAAMTTTVDVLTGTTNMIGLNTVTMGNYSTEMPGINVLEFACFCKFSAMTCARNGVLSLLIVFLGFLFLLRAYQLHRLGQRYYHQIFVYWIAIIECILVTVHWVYMHMVQVEAIVQYLRLVQLLIICHFYLSRATRLLRWEASKIFMMMALGIFFLYFTAVVVVIIVAATQQSTTTLMSCFDPFWVLLSLAECILVQMFLLCGLYITKKMNQVVTLESSRRTQIKDLWSIIIAFEIASITALVYDLVMYTAGSDNCSEIYNSDELVYSIVYIFLMIFTIFTPLLVLLLVFHPIDREMDESSPLLPSRSVFRPTFFDQRQRVQQIGRRVTYSESSIQAPRTPSTYRKVHSYPRLPIIQEESAKESV